MAKVKKAFFCKSCGFEAPQWYGKCPSCGEWNTFTEEVIARENGGGTAALGVIAAVCAISQSKKVAKRKAAEQAA